MIAKFSGAKVKFLRTWRALPWTCWTFRWYLMICTIMANSSSVISRTSLVSVFIVILHRAAKPFWTTDAETRWNHRPMEKC